MVFFVQENFSSTFLCAVTRIHEELNCTCAYILVLPILIPKFVSLFQPLNRKKKTNPGLTLRKVAEINSFWCGQNMLSGNNLKRCLFLEIPVYLASAFLGIYEVDNTAHQIPDVFRRQMLRLNRGPLNML